MSLQKYVQLIPTMWIICYYDSVHPMCIYVLKCCICASTVQTSVLVSHNVRARDGNSKFMRQTKLDVQNGMKMMYGRSVIDERTASLQHIRNILLFVEQQIQNNIKKSDKCCACVMLFCNK